MSTYSSKSNAKRAADKMIAKGEAPAASYTIAEVYEPAKGDKVSYEVCWDVPEAVDEVPGEDVRVVQVDADPTDEAIEALDEPAADEAEEGVPSDAELLCDMEPIPVEPSILAGAVPAVEDEPAAVSEAAMAGGIDADALLAEAQEVPVADVVAAPKAPKAKAPKPVGPRAAKKAAEEALAATGALPARLVLDGAYKANAKHADKLWELAQAGDLAAVEAYPLVGDYTSMNRLKRWRELAVIALKAAAAVKAAA